MPRRPEDLTPIGDLYERLRPSLTVDWLTSKRVSIVGGAFGLAADLARCGLGHIVYCDLDRVEGVNIPRQDFDQTEAHRNLRKVDAVAARIRAINPACEVQTLHRDITTLNASEQEVFYGRTDLIIAAADDFRANAHVNTEAARRGIPIIHASLYASGGAGEIIYWVHPSITPAGYCCIASGRYRYFASGHNPKTPSDGATIFDLRAVDAVAGHIALGILTRGADNRYGRLIEALGPRNLIQIRNSHEWLLGGRKDIFKAHLGDSPANFSFTAICLPMEPEPDCPECAALHRDRQA